MTCTENLLNVGKRPQDSDRAGKSSQNQEDKRKKREKMRKEAGQDLQPQEGAGKKKSSYTVGSAPTSKEINQDRRGTLCSPGGERSDQCVGIKTEKFFL